MTEPRDRLTAALADRYTIERELGAGGMATVYLAHDPKHNRKLAVKVLRPELAAILGGERFLKEIEVTANLQHPHILGLIDSGDADGLLWYAMPFVEGESLRDRLERETHLPVSDAVRIAGEVASALDYAHRRGVIHRDIKPENILLHDGRALVADFGIALAVSSIGGARLTETGLSLGTPLYMSPEQAMGEQALTARCDVYALGCVLYEMLVGEPPFTGPTPQAVIALLLSETPRSLTALRHTVPPHVEAVVLSALEKLPADRPATAAEFAGALAGPGATPAPGRAAATRRSTVPWVLAGAALVVAAIAWLRPSGARLSIPPSRLAINVVGLGGSGGLMLARQLTLAPDGASVVFAIADESGVNQLVRRALDADTHTALSLPQGGASNGFPQLSPDGRRLATINAQGLGSIHTVAGEPGGTVLPIPSVSATAWTPSGDLWAGIGPADTMLALVGDGDSVIRYVATGGRAATLQQVLPDGRHALVVMRRDGSTSGPPAVLDLETGRSMTVGDDPVVEVRYTAGFLISVLGNGTLQATPFDVGRRTRVGSAVSIARDVSLTGTGIAQIAVAANGTVAYIPEGAPPSLVLVDRNGNARDVVPDRRNFHAPLLSPDGRHVAVDFNTAEGRNVWVVALEEGTMTRATFTGDGHDATWSPDGRFLAFTSFVDGVPGVYRTRPGATEPAESLRTMTGSAYTGVWLRDGSAMITAENNLRAGSRLDIALIPDEGRGVPQPLVASAFRESYPAVSPDERWLAFTSDQSGRDEVYVRPFPRGGDPVQVSQGGATEPVWRRDGTELFYVGREGGEQVLVAAAVVTEPTFAARDRRVLFPISDYVRANPHSNYDVTPDGRGFVMVRRSRGTRIMIIQNLPALVAARRGT